MPSVLARLTASGPALLHLALVSGGGSCMYQIFVLPVGSYAPFKCQVNKPVPSDAFTRLENGNRSGNSIFLCIRDSSRC